MGGSSQVFVTNLIDLSYWKQTGYPQTLQKATSYPTTEMDNCSALLVGKIMAL